MLNTYAAIDLGSNSFHMIVAQESDGQFKIIDRLREMVRLAAGLDDKLNITAEAEQRALECLARFGQRIASLHADKVRAVGTNTLRRARNSRAFLAQAGEALGYPIDIISGVEEARLVYGGAAHDLPQIEGRRLVADIGGGSTEIIIGQGSEPLFMESLYMGCVSLSQRFFSGGKITRKRFDKAILAARLELEPYETGLRARGWEHAVGTSGSFKSVAAVLRESGWDKEGISPQGLDLLIDKMIETGHSDKLELAGLGENRRPVFAGGVAIVRAICQTLDIARMDTCSSALREGVVYDLAGRAHAEDARANSVTQLSHRHGVDQNQATRVERSALQFLAQVAEDWGLDDNEHACFLAWSARLHEVGLNIAHGQYHKHGAYLVAHSDMAGFSIQEQNRLALLVRAHRRKFPAALFNDLPTQQAKFSQRLAVLLRLAVVMNRGHSDADPTTLKLHADKNTLRLELPEEWSARHPLTHADLQVEQAYLVEVGLDLQFE